MWDKEGDGGEIIGSKGKIGGYSRGRSLPRYHQGMYIPNGSTAGSL
jgi:hypothetical protein